MKVHPALAFGAVIAGTALLGAVGALLALPVAATLQAFFSTFMARYNVEVDVTAGALPETDVEHDGHHEHQHHELSEVHEPASNEHASNEVTSDALKTDGGAEVIEPDA